MPDSGVAEYRRTPCRTGLGVGGECNWAGSQVRRAEPASRALSRLVRCAGRRSAHGQKSSSLRSPGVCPGGRRGATSSWHGARRSGHRDGGRASGAITQASRPGVTALWGDQSLCRRLVPQRPPSQPAASPLIFSPRLHRHRWLITRMPVPSIHPGLHIDGLFSTRNGDEVQFRRSIAPRQQQAQASATLMARFARINTFSRPVGSLTRTTAGLLQAPRARVEVCRSGGC